jgi:hypothetical protein
MGDIGVESLQLRDHLPDWDQVALDLAAHEPLLVPFAM